MEVYLCFVATNGSIVLKVACFQARPIHGIPSDSESHKHLLLRQPRKIDMKIMIYHHNSRILSSGPLQRLICCTVILWFKWSNHLLELKVFCWREIKQ